MNYRKYLKGISKSIHYVVDAKKNNVALSRYENFDYMFKKELAICEGIRKDRNLFARMIDSVRDLDYRLACFYAEAFSDIVDILVEGYSYDYIAWLFSELYHDAKTKGIYGKNLNIDIDDYCNEYTVEISKGNEELFSYSITNISECVGALLEFVQDLGSMGESSEDSKKWFGNYLSGELSRVLKNQEAEPYIENKNVVVNLKEYSKSSTKIKKIDSKGNIIQFKVG